MFIDSNGNHLVTSALVGGSLVSQVVGKCFKLQTLLTVASRHLLYNLLGKAKLILKIMNMTQYPVRRLLQALSQYLVFVLEFPPCRGGRQHAGWWCAGERRTFAIKGDVYQAPLVRPPERTVCMHNSKKVALLIVRLKGVPLYFLPFYAAFGK